MPFPHGGMMLSNSDGQYVNVDGIRTFYFKVGTGFPVVLIHGASPGACSATAWHLNIEPLAKAGFCFYAFDQPGFGLTDNPPDHSIEFRVTHAKAFIQAMGLDRFHVIGNSVGGYIAARFALEDRRVGGFVTTTSGTLAPKGSGESQALAKKHGEELREYTPSPENMRKLTLGTIFHKELVTDDIVRARYEMSTGKNHEAHLARRDASPPRPIFEELRNIKTKSLLLWGKNDSGVTVERGLLLFDLIPNAEFHLFDQCAHWVQWDQAKRFNGIVTNFLSELQ
jgi:pimeloyl-ACP methyl ester carboxylesterase